MFSFVSFVEVERLAKLHASSDPCPADFARVHFAGEEESKHDKDKSQAYKLKIY